MVWSYLFILPVPRSIKKPDQNNMFHNDFGLNCDSMTNGVFLYPSFLAMIILSEGFFFNFTVAVPSSGISVSLTLLVPSYNFVPSSLVNVIVCMALETKLMQDVHSNSGMANANMRDAFFI